MFCAMQCSATIRRFGVPREELAAVRREAEEGRKAEAQVSRGGPQGGPQGVKLWLATCACCTRLSTLEGLAGSMRTHGT